MLANFLHGDEYRPYTGVGLGFEIIGTFVLVYSLFSAIYLKRILEIFMCRYVFKHFLSYDFAFWLVFKCIYE